MGRLWGKGAGRAIMEVLHAHAVENMMAVVSRHFISHIGPMLFNIIKQCTFEVVQQFMPSLSTSISHPITTIYKGNRRKFGNTHKGGLHTGNQHYWTTVPTHKACNNITQSVDSSQSHNQNVNQYPAKTGMAGSVYSQKELRTQNVQTGLSNMGYVGVEQIQDQIPFHIQVNGSVQIQHQSYSMKTTVPHNRQDFNT